MSEKEEDEIGKREHPKIIKSFGGVYKNEKLQNYIESLGEFLVNTSELPEKIYIYNIKLSNCQRFCPSGWLYLPYKRADLFMSK